MTHRQACRLVELNGGQPMQHVSQQTTLLIVGEEGWPLESDGQPSQKLLQARQLQDRGFSVKIMTESEWLAILGLRPPQAEHHLFTPAALSQMLGVSTHTIRRWERLGFIKPVRRVYRLSYFDYAQVLTARRLIEWLSRGISLAALAESLRRLQSWLPQLQLPDLESLYCSSRSLVIRDEAGWIEAASGQRLLIFDESMANPPLSVSPSAQDAESSSEKFSAAAGCGLTLRTADDWYRHGCLLIEQEAYSQAVEAFRSALIIDSEPAHYHFHLADALYRLGRREAAAERYYCALERDQSYLEAWTQLGCVLAELGDEDGARLAFETALQWHPDYADAHFLLAQWLARHGLHDQANHHWSVYLRLEPTGPWATLAHQALFPTEQHEEGVQNTESLQAS